MHPNRIRSLWFGFGAFAMVIGSACGGSEAEPQVDLLEPIDQPADREDQQISDEDGELTISRLCDPIAPLVSVVVGDSATTVHNDFYADRADRILDCGWESVQSDRTLRVGFNGAPGDFMINVSDGKQDLLEVDAPNAYASSRTDVLAPNGWTITIQNLGADAVDERAAIVAIANAALAAISS